MDYEFNVKAMNHVDSGLSKVLSQYSESPVYLALLISYLKSVQDAEEVADALSQGIGIATAVGKQLDNIGALFKEPRGDANDDEYRLKILIAVIVKQGNGVAGTIQQTMRLVTGSPIAKPYEGSQAAFGIACSGSRTPSNTEETLNKLSSIGVNNWYYEMGRTMKWRGTETLSVKDYWVNEDGEKVLYSDIDGSANMTFNAGLAYPVPKAVASYAERPKRDRKYWSVASKAKTPDALKRGFINSDDDFFGGITGAGFIEDPLVDERGVHAETYYRVSPLDTRQ